MPGDALVVVAADRFWAKVDRSGDCWLWTASQNSQHADKATRYGQFFIRKDHGRTKLASAHRYAWELHFGPIPPGQSVLHRCDNGLCVRPEHLFLGDHQSNMADMKAKGRGAKTHPRQRGLLNPSAKLDGNAVRAIRLDAAAGVSYREIGRRYGVSKSNVHVIASGQSWAWLP